MSDYKMKRVAGGWHILKGDTVLWPEPSEENATVIFSLLTDETAPLHARIAELEAWLTTAWQYTPTDKLPQELFESFQGVVMDGDSTHELIKAFLSKKAPDHD